MNADVLAATLTIVFEGLLAFVGPDAGGEKNKTHVVIMDDQHHHAKLKFTEDGDSSPTEMTLKEDDRITFSVGSGVATTDTVFDDRVPTLSDYIHSGDLDTNVKNKKAVKDVVLGYVELPNGSLTATGSLAHPAQFTKKDQTKDIRCPARTVVFTMTLAEGHDPVQITIAGNPPRRPRMRTLDVSQPITLENTTMRLGNHFKKFAGLLTFGGTLGFVTEITSQDCDKDGNVLSRSETVARRREAAKRRREKRGAFEEDAAPNGDCGPVDYP